MSLLKEYKTPNKLYNIENDEAVWTDEGEDWIYWSSEADEWEPQYAKSYTVKMSPKDFLDLTTREGADKLVKGDRLGGTELRDLDMDEFNNQKHQPLFLEIAFKKNTPLIANVVGHEGRHRAFALMNAGVKSVQVALKCDIYDTSFNKYKPYDLSNSQLTLIGQFNKNVFVEVKNPFTLSWENHLKQKPDAKERKNYREGMKLRIFDGDGTEYVPKEEDKEPTPTKIIYWWDRQRREWCIEVLDETGNVIDSDYAGNKDDAISSAKWFQKVYGIPFERYTSKSIS